MTNELEKGIYACWGEHGAHAEAFNDMEKELSTLRAENERKTRALERISHAKPDRLDHSLDVTIIERCARVARAALAPRGQEGEGK